MHFCTKCGEFSVANNKCINWIQCETCNRWFHEKCLKLQEKNDKLIKYI